MIKHIQIAIVVIQKYEFAEKDFTEDNADDSFLKHIETETVMLNNIYSDFTGLVDPKFNSENSLEPIYCNTEFNLILFSHFRTQSIDNLSGYWKTYYVSS